MKKIVLLLSLLIASPAFAANNFSGDEDVVAVYNFDTADGITKDSIGANDLTDINTCGTSADAKQGDQSVDLDRASDESLEILQADMSADFPGKDGTANRVFSVCAWVKFDAFDNAHHESWANVWGDTSLADRSWAMMKRDNDDADANKVEFWIGYNNGGSGEGTPAFATALTEGIWYHVSITLDVDKNYRIRIWDDNAGDQLDDDRTGTFTNTMNIEASGGQSFDIGWYGDSPNNNFDGHVDELVIFKRALSVEDIDDIRAGTFGAGEPPAAPGGVPTQIIINVTWVCDEIYAGEMQG